MENFSKILIIENETLRLRFFQEFNKIVISGSLIGIGNQEEVCSFEFIENDKGGYSGNDAAIFKQSLKRKGIYTFVINTIEKEFNTTITPSLFLSNQGKKFWRKRLQKYSVK